ncbi:DNRLRE domain-containing protein [Paenibacillus lutrae]|uniref:DNRLRE domain-containing protein n=1 Tax=Paenibacillus lutrae TaxID=2078573 RepID=A0A7X3FJC0_9BACL|nr:DNRLRE domain-containing protein [Paenibacillus lutrae]MVP00793.1 DNRLRE domain-containing protein [Paenibacillus lutrae]
MFIIKESTQAEFQDGLLDPNLIVSPFGELKINQVPNKTLNLALNKPYTKVSDGKIKEPDVNGRMLTDGNTSSYFNYQDVTYVDTIVDLGATHPVSAATVYGAPTASSSSPRLLDVSVSLDGFKFSTIAKSGDMREWSPIISTTFPSENARYVKFRVHRNSDVYWIDLAEIIVNSGTEHRYSRIKTYDISNLSHFNGALLHWGAWQPTNTNILVELCYSLDDGGTWSSYEQIENGNAITSIPFGTDLSKAKLRVRQTLISCGISTPSLFDFRIYFNELDFNSGYVSSPYYGNSSTVNVIPAMTADNAPSPYVVKVSKLYTNSKAYAAFDNNLTSSHLAYDGKTAKVQIDVGPENMFPLAGYRIYINGNTPISWTMEASQNEVDWITLDQQININWSKATNKYLDFKINKKHFENYRFYRLNISDSSYLYYNYISELQLFSRTDGLAHHIKANLTVRDRSDLPSTIQVKSPHSLLSPIGYLDYGFVPVMSSNYFPAPYEISASSEINSLLAYKAFNGTIVDSNDNWSPENIDPSWIKVFFGYQNRRAVNKYAITGNLRNLENPYPKSWVVEASNNNQDWVALDTRTNETKWGYPKARREYTFNNSTPYEYYRFQFNETNGHPLSIGEITLYENAQQRATDVTSTLTVPIGQEILCILHVPPYNRLFGKVDITPLLLFDITNTINVGLNESLLTSIQVPVHNRMSGVIDIIPPPIVNRTLLPHQDAFVRESIPKLNYGTEQDMFIGYNANLNERYRSFLQFDLSLLPKFQKITKAELLIYFDYENQPEIDIGLFPAESAWNEIGLTWDNQPRAHSLASQNKVGAVKGYLSFDILGLVKDWYDNPQTNYGVLLQAMDELTDNHKRFYTKEQLKYPPLLELEYLDQNVYSEGRASIPICTLIVRQSGVKELTTKIGIREIWLKEGPRSQIHVKSPYFLENSIHVNSPKLWSSIRVRRSDEKILDSTIAVRIKLGDPLITDLTVSRNFLRSQIRIRISETSDLKSSIKGHERTTQDSVISISRPFLESSIRVGIISAISSSIRVRVEDDADVTGSILIRQSMDIDLKTQIRVFTHNEVPSSITVLSGYLRTVIAIPMSGDKNIRTYLTVQTKLAKDITSILRVYSESEESSYVFII